MAESCEERETIILTVLDRMTSWWLVSSLISLAISSARPQVPATATRIFVAVCIIRRGCSTQDSRWSLPSSCFECESSLALNLEGRTLPPLRP